MNYEETIQYLYQSAPLFQHQGGTAYKEGLSTTLKLDEHFNHPHKHFRTIHVAGTNGKGSCAHTIAAILQAAGYKVGLYTSPHLTDFRERIRVNGYMIPKQYVVDFVEQEKNFFEPLFPSFFELTTALAFKYFKEMQVDVAVIEVGLGGRLDCTNIISPDLSIITNIGFDHMHFLGNTLEDIATEKAGIIKKRTPVIIGEHTPETKEIFIQKTQTLNAPIRFATDCPVVIRSQFDEKGGISYHTSLLGSLHGALGGIYQEKNTNTILNAIVALRENGYSIADEHIRTGFGMVCELTGLRGRWQVISQNPLTICDTAHNIDGFKTIVKQLSMLTYHRLHIIIGMVNDKDIDGVLSILPTDAIYYFTRASVARSLSEQEIREKAAHHHLNGNAYSNVKEAFIAAQKDVSSQDLIYIGGSNFIVADFLDLNL